MKLNNSYLIHFCGGKKQETKKGETKPASTKPIEANASDCQSAYNIGTLKSKINSDIYLNKATKYVQKIIKDDEHISRQNISTSDGETIARLRIGREIEGFPDLYYDDIRIACYFDKDDNISSAFKLDNNTRELFVYDRYGKQTHHFTKEDRDALHYYKYHPDSIHTKFRNGKNYWGGSFQDETDEMAKRLVNIFNNESKIFRTTENKTLYRALQKNLTEEQINTLSTIGGIYTDPSFCSTAEDLSVAKRFSCGNPILKINVPQGTKYMDIERLFNIDIEHWREKELLLNRNSSFLVTGFDTENNIIEVDYIG